MNKKEMILEVAEKLFANEGYTATSIDDIARKCDITKAAIYYHFKNKYELYVFILENNFSLLAKAVEDAVDSKNEVKEMFIAYVVTIAKQFCENKYIASLLMREMANGGKDMPIDALKQMLRTFKVLSLVIDKGKNEELFECVEPMYMQMMILGSLSFLFTTQKLREKANIEIDASLKTLTKHSFEEAAEKISHTLLNSLKK
ncbi:MAG: TetR/AcrR family transcriptional regulator [Sulfurimonas sp.]|nr:TetR/AcrR family transcriptional regulator [Sulfurimonas sp.]